MPPDQGHDAPSPDTAAGASVEKARTAPDPDHPAKPASPTDLSKPSWRFTARKAWQEFGHDQCTDIAAALTYYAVLALFPALLALVSLLGVFGQGESTVDAMLQLVRSLGQQGAAEVLQEPVRQMVTASGAGVGLTLGLLTALWSASGYVGAFGRAMNRVYEVDEGRPAWKLRPLQLLVTTGCILAVALVLVAIVLSGPVATSVAQVAGIGQGAVTVFDILKWPVILAVVVVIVAVLYYATPNVQQPKFRWISVGAGIAILVWLVLSLGFGFYVANFGSYNKTYGSLAGVVVFLLWLWLTNLALLFGAQVDSELERARQLEAGIPAEESLQLPPRDTTKSEKTAAKHEASVAQGRAIRKAAQAAQAEREREARRARRGDRSGPPRHGDDPGQGHPGQGDPGQGDPGRAGRSASGLVIGAGLGSLQNLVRKILRR